MRVTIAYIDTNIRISFLITLFIMCITIQFKDLGKPNRGGGDDVMGKMLTSKERRQNSLSAASVFSSQMQPAYIYWPRVHECFSCALDISLLLLAVNVMSIYLIERTLYRPKENVSSS